MHRVAPAAQSLVQRAGLVVPDLVAQTIESLNLHYPNGDAEEQQALAEAQTPLEDEQQAADG